MIVSPFFQLDQRSARSVMGVVNVSNEISARSSRAINIMLTYSENSVGALVIYKYWYPISIRLASTGPGDMIHKQAFVHQRQMMAS